MPVIISQTPNPNALKFTVSTLFAAPKSFTAGKPTDDPIAAPLLAIPGVTSVFMSADFVTLTKDPAAHWDEIVPDATGILEITFG